MTKCPTRKRKRGVLRYVIVLAKFLCTRTIAAIVSGTDTNFKCFARKVEYTL